MTPPVTHLTIDIGNSAVKALLFREGREVGPVLRFGHDEWPVLDRAVTNQRVDNIIYSTVANVPPAQWLDERYRAGTAVYALAELPLGFPSAYTTPATLGQDRRAAVAAARALAPGRLRLVADAGSCLTLDVIAPDGTYLGGNISPGRAMRLRAMHEFTGRLPPVEAGEVSGAVGTSTVSALRHGGQLGLVYEIEGLSARLATDHGQRPELFLTGGDAVALGHDLALPHVIYPNLVLRGLYQTLITHAESLR